MFIIPLEVSIGNYLANTNKTNVHFSASVVGVAWNTLLTGHKTQGGKYMLVGGRGRVLCYFCTGMSVFPSYVFIIHFAMTSSQHE